MHTDLDKRHGTHSRVREMGSATLGEGAPHDGARGVGRRDGGSFSCFVCLCNVSSVSCRRPLTQLPLVLLGQDIDVELLHDLEYELEAVEEGVDGDAEHAVRGGLVVDVQDLEGRGGLLILVGVGGSSGSLDGELAAHERGELRVDLEGAEGGGGEARRGEGHAQGSGGARVDGGTSAKGLYCTVR